AINGTRRWIRLGPVSFQPVELAKLALVVYLAAFLARKRGELDDFRTGALPPLLVGGVLAALVLVQPDLGNCMTLIVLTFGLLYLAGSPIKHLAWVAAPALPLIVLAVWMAPYRMRRITAFMDPWGDPRGSGFQIIQSWLALGNGGLVGQGIGGSRQKLFYLPESHTDFIFAVVGEELGFLGAAAFVALFAVLVWRGLRVGLRTSEPFGAYLALGITLLIATQPLVNLGAGNVEGAHVVVYSSAISRDNVELVTAHNRQIPIIPRAEMLAELMRLKYGIAVAGTHGKTTTTSLVGAVLAEGRYDPTIVVGGRVTNLGSNARLGQGEYLVAEADESDGSFLKLAPTIAVVTTIDAEHLDHYRTLDAIREAFVAFVNKVPFYGSAVLCLDQPNIQMLLPRLEKRVITYGLESGADLVARRLQLAGMTSRFDVYQRGTLLGDCMLQIPGRHNVLNALAAVGVGLDLEIPFLTIQKALAGFAGVQRRFQIRGTAAGVTVVDDYGHHP